MMDDSSPDCPALPGPSRIAPEKNIKRPKLIHTYNVATSNAFAPLSTSNDIPITDGGNKEQHKPPPIYIRNIHNINVMLKEINQLSPGPYRHVTIGDRLKLNVDNVEDYRKIIHYLQSKNAEYHTFQLKTEKNFRVVVRGLHPTCDTGLMMEELSSLGFAPTQMLPVHHPVTKTPLPLFFLDLKPDKNNSKIYELNRLYGAVIKIEPPKPRRTVVQCIKCQQFGHTKNYCFQSPRCVKCDGSHATDRCTKLPNAPPVCTNCKGPHPASYKGCPEHKRHQLNKPQLATITTSRHSPLIKPTPSHAQSTATTTSATPKKLYSEAVRPPQPQVTTTDTQDNMLTTLLQKIDSLIAIIQPLALTLAQILPKLLKLDD